MAGQQGQDLTRQTVDRFKARATEYAQGIAQRMGPPAGGTKLDNETQVRLWNFSPHPDPAMAFATLKAGGMPDGQALDQTYPYRRKLFQAPTVKEQITKAESIKAMAEGHPEHSANGTNGTFHPAVTYTSAAASGQDFGSGRGTAVQQKAEGQQE